MSERWLCRPGDGVQARLGTIYIQALCVEKNQGRKPQKSKNGIDTFQRVLIKTQFTPGTSEGNWKTKKQR